MTPSSPGVSHDAAAPYWAAALVVLCTAGLLSGWLHLGWFWSGYVLDMAGPAWSYILVRGLFTGKTDNAWTRFFTPTRTLVVFVAFCAGVEGAQYLELYDATFDPWDLLAYVSILVPLFVVDRHLESRRAG